MTKILALLMILLLATSCASAPKSLPLSQKPTISCGENYAIESLPTYPALPDIPYADPVLLDQYKANAVAWKDTSDMQTMWELKAVEVSRVNNLHRQATARCLNALRKQGIIQ